MDLPIRADFGSGFVRDDHAKRLLHLHHDLNQFPSMTPPCYVAPSSSWHWPEPLSRQTRPITGDNFGGGLFAERDMPEILAWQRGSRNFGVSVVQWLSRPATNAIVTRHILPPLSYSGPDYLPKGSLRTHNPAFKPFDNPRRVEKSGDSVEVLLIRK